MNRIVQSQTRSEGTEMTTSSPILVTGATGRHGGTGAYLVGRLREEGRAVRVLVRAHTDRTAALAALGVEVVIGDLQDRRSIVPALDGVELAYFTYPIDAGVVSAAANYAAAVREAGTSPRTVVMSMGPAHPDHLSDRGRDQWLAEEVLRWAGLTSSSCASRPRSTKTFRLCTAGRSVNAVSSAIVSAVPLSPGSTAAMPVSSPSLHSCILNGSPAPICYPTGAEELNHTDIATILTEELRRPVRFDPVSRDEWHQELVELSTLDPGGVVNPDMAVRISAVGLSIAQHGPSRSADVDALARLIGRTPLTFRQYVRADPDALFPTDRPSGETAGEIPANGRHA
jgi:Predicted nucleoside-diphosphate-sugar epimerases